MLITYSKELVDGKPLYAFSNSLPVKSLNREPAGHAFHSAALKLHGCAEELSDGGEGSDKKDGDDKEKEYVPSFNPYANRRKKNKKKKKSGTQQQDHYALLGLRSLRCLATEDQIKKSYREAALKYHPDKLAALVLEEETEEGKEVKKEEIASRFGAIQEAYEVLMDSNKRRMFDSRDEFEDEEEEEEEISPREFFMVFGSAFKRYAKWSVNQQRVPDLGDEYTKIKDVFKFYSFWYGFKSCREFPDDDLENAKKTAKFRKEEEHVRIRNLVENAYRNDPRILKREEEEKAEKQRKKEAKKKEEEEAAMAAEEVKRKKEEEVKRAKETAQEVKKTKEKEKKLLRKERNRLRTLSAPLLAQRLLDHDISEEDVENLCMSLNVKQLQNLCDTMENKQGVEELAKVIKDISSRNQETNSKKKESEKTNRETLLDDNTQKKKQPAWSKEEIDMLRKGMIKYPKGVSRRWEVISDYIGTGRSVEEILKATKTVLLQKPDSAKAFDSFLEKRKPSVSIASPLSTREELGESLPMAAKPPSKETEASGSSDSTNGWSAVLERALVQALKTFPKETSQRWERVAAAVPGKTMVQCKKKFAELKEFIRSKKTGV
ncbi:hypothetical protein N665_0257s0079 [Sinapis alba]|nr:hypothetical protein N665_0257s0079 [Sinapis alba]